MHQWSCWSSGPGRQTPDLMHFLQVRGGRIIEPFASHDDLGMMLQPGVLRAWIAAAKPRWLYQAGGPPAAEARIVRQQPGALHG